MGKIKEFFDTEGSENSHAPYGEKNTLKAIPIKLKTGSSHCGSAVMNTTSIHKDVGSIPGLTQWVKERGLP